MLRLGWFARMVLAGLLLAPIFALPAPSSAAASLVVAWVADGELFVWQIGDSEPRRIDGGDVIRPFLSPDGTQIAYLRGPSSDPQSLWISDIAGSDAHRLVDALTLLPADPTRRPWQVVWTAGQIYFNTLTGQQISLHTADDLWRADPLSGTVERLLPDGSGGRIFPSPDGLQLALVSAGAYIQPGEESHLLGSISFYDVATGTSRTALEFPAVATGSEWRWYPVLRWQPDGRGVLTAIPAPDLIYSGGDTALWSLASDGDPVQLGSVGADFFGLPVFSAHGDWIAYIDHRKSSDQTDLTLMVAESDGSGRKSYAQGRIGSLGPANWLPDDERFVFTNGVPGDLWFGGPNITAARFPSADVAVSDLVWTSGSLFVLSTRVDGAPALMWASLDAPSSLHTIAQLDTAPFFDAVSP